VTKPSHFIFEDNAMRRPVAVKQSSSGSMWDKEASEYWKQMKLDDSKQMTNKKRVMLFGGAALVITALVGGGIVWSRQASDPQPGGIEFENIIRANCTKVVVQSRWHDDMCKKICPTYV
jgi:hypothetical protein